MDGYIIYTFISKVYTNPAPTYSKNKNINITQQGYEALKPFCQDWFVAKDVCEALGLKNVSEAISRLDEDEKLLSELMIAGQMRKVSIINESGLYNLILTSTKPAAKAMKKWKASLFSSKPQKPPILLQTPKVPYKHLPFLYRQIHRLTQ